MEFTFEMFITLALVCFAIAGYASGKFPIDAVSISVLGLLFFIFEVFPVQGINFSDFIDGFANHGLLTVMALLVVAQGVHTTGVLNTFVDNIINLKSKPDELKSTLLIMTLFIVALFSSIMNNTPIIIIFIPLIAIIADKLGFSASKALIPLSYAGILGGMITLVGSSTNIIGAGVAKDLGIEGINFFTVTIPGLSIAVPGLLFVIFLLPKLMPKTDKLSSTFSDQQQKFIAQIEISEGSDLIGESTENGKFNTLPNMNILLIQRGEHAFSAYQSIPIEKNDIIIVQADRKTLENALNLLGEQLHPQFSDTKDVVDSDSDEQILVEALISPDSRMAGKNLEQARFRKLTGCIALGIKRTSRIFREQITDIVLEAGDVLLVQGTKISIENLKSNQDVTLLDYTYTELHRKKFARRSIIIFLITIFTIATGILPTVAAAMIGAASMIASGALSAERAINSLDRHVFLTIVSMLALSHAILMTGLSEYGAIKILEYTGEMGPVITLSFVFLFISILTNFLTNNASAALFMPLGISIAHSLNIDPLVCVITVILASNCSFATPYGYQTNLLVMAPGNYSLKHFLIGGIPLTLISWICFTIFVPWYYGIY